ncbi:MAG TPA: hypothetical protein EYM84_06925 [Flavobacteriales bacterium]|nr:hypothetical protein [Flavobacteriales bacterium]HIN39988.1 hypothetical protein [Flavobacteriales bacterium]
MGSAVNEDDNDIIQYYMGNESPLVNQSYLDTFIKLKKEFNAVILGLSKKVKGEYTLIKNPKEDLPIKEGDYIILLANGKSIPGIQNFVGISEGRLAKHQ